MCSVTVLVLAVSAALTPALAAPRFSRSGVGLRRSDILQMRQTSDASGRGLVDKGNAFRPDAAFHLTEDFSIGSIVKIAEEHA